jgi:hypothetical protein
MKDQILTALKKVLPSKAFILVEPYKCLGEEHLKIAFAASEININDVRGQKPQIVSLCLRDLELSVQAFGGNGGQVIYRQPNMEDSKEKYLAMQSIKIPFRQPKKEEKAILKAVEKFANNWLQALKDNQDKLTHQNLVNYQELLGA